MKIRKITALAVFLVLSVFISFSSVNICMAKLPSSPETTWINITKKQAKEYEKQGIPIIDTFGKVPLIYHQKFPYTKVNRQPSDWKFHDDLIAYTKMHMKDPDSFKELSYFENEDDYAVLAFTATNGYGGRVRGYTKGVWARYQPYIWYSHARKDYMYFPGGEDFYKVTMY